MDLKKFQHGAKQKGKGKGKPKADLPPATSNLEHNCRTSTPEHADRDRGNEKIDPARTHLNYDLAAPLRNGKSALEIYAEKYKAACEDFAAKNGKALRGDAVTLMSWVVTAPKDLPAEHHTEFFKGAFEWLANRYGAENVIAANVHLDETTPHMHFQFLPLVEDKEHGGVKLCAKGLETAASMKKIHPELQKYLSEKLGVKVHLLNGATEHGKKTIEEMKLETLENAVKEDVFKKTGAIKKIAEKLSGGKKLTPDEVKNVKNIAASVTTMETEYGKMTEAAAEAQTAAEALTAEAAAEKEQNELDRADIERDRRQNEQNAAEINERLQALDLKTTLEGRLQAERILHRAGIDTAALGGAAQLRRDTTPERQQTAITAAKIRTEIRTGEKGTDLNDREDYSLD